MRRESTGFCGCELLKCKLCKSNGPDGWPRVGWWRGQVHFFWLFPKSFRHNNPTRWNRLIAVRETTHQNLFGLDVYTSWSLVPKLARSAGVGAGGGGRQNYKRYPHFVSCLFTDLIYFGLIGRSVPARYRAPLWCTRVRMVQSIPNGLCWWIWFVWESSVTMSHTTIFKSSTTKKDIKMTFLWSKLSSYSYNCSPWRSGIFSPSLRRTHLQQVARAKLVKYGIGIDPSGTKHASPVTVPVFPESPG